MFIAMFSKTVLAAEKIVKVGIYLNKPLIFIDKHKQVKGLYPDLINHIAAKENWKIVYVPGSWTENLYRLENSQIDLMVAIAYSKERAEKYDYINQTVLSNWGVFYIRKGASINSFTDLEGKKIAVLKNDIYLRKIRKILDRFNVKSEFLEFENYHQVFKSIERGDVEAGIVNRLFASQNDKNIDIQKSSIIFAPLEIRMAVPKGKSQNLLKVLDKHLITMKRDKNSYYYKVLEQWIDFTGVEKKVIPIWLIVMLVLVTIMGLLFMAVSGMLVVQVKNRKRAENEAQKAKESAQQANRAKSVFLANMSHEIRTPLNAVINLTDHLLKEQLAPKYIKELKIIKNAGDHLLTVISDILDISKIESRKFSLKRYSFNLHESIETIIETLKTHADQKGILLKMDIDANVPVLVKGDGFRLGQILFNLINNAIKFTHKGSVTVKVTNSLHTEKNMELLFSVKDTGIGIAAEDQELIFDDFHQLACSKKHQGTGLGLTICKELVSLMEGKIWVTSEIGLGTIFSFTLVFSTPDTTKMMHTQKSIINTNDYSGLKILMAEDNESNIAVAKVFFEDFDIALTSVNNGEQALEAMKKTSFDIILMDLEMPVMNGIECTKKIRSGETENSTIPIIVLSAHSTVNHEEVSLQAGANSYLSKPIDFNKLFDQIASLTKISKQEKNIPKTDLLLQKEQFTKTFLAEIPLIKQALQAHLCSGDFENIRKIAHKHISSSALLGFDNIAQILKKIEKQALTENIAQINTLYRDLEHQLDSIKDQKVDL